MFQDFKKALQKNFNKLQKQRLYYVEIDRDKIFEVYLNGFTEEYRQEHNCNCCKSFLRQYGGIVTIINGKMVSIWDNLEVPEMFAKSVEALSAYINSLSIKSVFFNDSVNCGTDKNLDNKKNIIWNHFYLLLDKAYVKNRDSIATVQSDLNSTKDVLKRGLEELSLDAVDTVLELIDQNSLYRGNEFKGMVTEFGGLKKKFDKASNKDTFCWYATLNTFPAVCRIKNSSIGTLLVDLTEGMELDNAVRKFESVVAPTNYKRPTALVTNKMVEDAKKTLSDLGLLDSLDRKYATLRDINTENLLFVDKSSEMYDVFGEISKETVVNPKSLTKVENISIEDFINKVIPKSKSLEILVENKHLNNFVSLLCSSNNSPSLFKWDNDFSWSYTGGITDSLRQKVVNAGGRVDGVFRFTHSWNEIEPNQSLMDLHVFLPGNNHKSGVHNNYGNSQRVGWNNRQHNTTSGVQDVDYVNPAPKGYIPVENITFPDLKIMPEGDYQCKIHNWSFRGTGGKGKAEIEFGGNIYQYEYPRTKNKEWVDVATVNLKNGVFTIKHHLKEKAESVNKWGLKTNTFVKVKQAMLSPNYWNNSVGNKHYLFMLEDCVSDEKPRPFFNEFLKQELDKNRKVFEILGSKVKVEDNPNQLSGLGFSETQKNSFIVRVEGSFKRTLMVNF